MFHNSSTFEQANIMNVIFPIIQLGILKKGDSLSVSEGTISIAPDLHDFDPQLSEVQ